MIVCCLDQGGGILIPEQMRRRHRVARVNGGGGRRGLGHTLPCLAFCSNVPQGQAGLKKKKKRQKRVSAAGGERTRPGLAWPSAASDLHSAGTARRKGHEGGSSRYVLS